MTKENKYTITAEMVKETVTIHKIICDLLRYKYKKGLELETYEPLHDRVIKLMAQANGTGRLNYVVTHNVGLASDSELYKDYYNYVMYITYTYKDKLDLSIGFSDDINYSTLRNLVV